MSTNDDTVYWCLQTYDPPVLAYCAGPVTSGFPSQRASNDFFFGYILNKLLNKQLSCQWFEMPWCSCDVTVLVMMMTQFIDAFTFVTTLGVNPRSALLREALLSSHSQLHVRSLHTVQDRFYHSDRIAHEMMIKKLWFFNASNQWYQSLPSIIEVSSSAI